MIISCKDTYLELNHRSVLSIIFSWGTGGGGGKGLVIILGEAAGSLEEFMSVKSVNP